jgi:hypothetical protein
MSVRVESEFKRCAVYALLHAVALEGRSRKKRSRRGFLAALMVTSVTKGRTQKTVKKI